MRMLLSMKITPYLWSVFILAQVYSHWSEWGECDQCDRKGRRQKFGTCMVKKIHKGRPIVPHDVPIIDQYPKGGVCAVYLLMLQQYYIYMYQKSKGCNCIMNMEESYHFLLLNFDIISNGLNRQ